MAMEVMDNYKGKRQKLGRACRALTARPSPGRGWERDLLLLGSDEPAGRSLGLGRKAEQVVAVL